MLNLTPHAITIRRADGSEVTIPPSGQVARVNTVERNISTFEGGVPVIVRIGGAATGLPEEGVPCLVSAMVLAAVPGRAGVYAPDSGPTAIRDERGQVVAVTRLVAA
jgi:hypothetical protein